MLTEEDMKKLIEARNKPSAMQRRRIIPISGVIPRRGLATIQYVCSTPVMINRFVMAMTMARFPLWFRFLMKLPLIKRIVWRWQWTKFIPPPNDIIIEEIRVGAKVVSVGAMLATYFLSTSQPLEFSVFVNAGESVGLRVRNLWSRDVCLQVAVMGVVSETQGQMGVGHHG